MAFTAPVAPRPFMTRYKPTDVAAKLAKTIEIAENLSFLIPIKIPSKVRATDWGKIARVAKSDKETLILSGSIRYRPVEKIPNTKDVSVSLSITTLQRSSEDFNLSLATSLTMYLLKPKSETAEMMAK